MDPTNSYDNSTADIQVSLGGINNPQLNPKTLVAGKTALTDEVQAWTVFDNLRQAQRERNGINAQIADNCNGKAPYMQTDIAAWQSNFSVLFLSGIIDKIVPILVAYVENAKYLTQSKLKDESQAGSEKSEKLRDEFTKTVRRWPGWRSFISSLCQELILIGYTFAVRTDEYDWRVKHYRQDQAFIPEGTSQFAEFVQVLAVKQDILIHELTEIIQDKEAAQAAKWDVEATATAINNAFPKNELTDDQSYNPRSLVDVIQEGNLGMSYSTGAKVVKLGHVFAVETADGGKVTHVILNREATHNALLWHESRFDSMRDVVTLFTLDPGNGNFYGSRGVGRRTVNYSVAMNSAVNDLLDQLRLAGLIVLQQDLAKGTPPPRVKRPFLWLNKDSELVTQRQGMNLNIEAGVTLINKLGEMAQIATQQYVPNTIAESTAQNSEKPTAHQVSIDYQREQQSTAAFIGRFAGQIAEMIGMMQRAMAHPDTNDADALEFRLNALGNEKKGIPAIVTEDELQEWAKSPAAEVLQDLTAQEAQMKLAAANDPELVQSPAINQKARLEMKLGAMLPQPLVQSLLKPDFIDPDEEAENFRQQQSETEDILKGLSVPVSGRDNHKVHLDVLLPDMLSGGQALQKKINENPNIVLNPQTGAALDHFSAGFKHASAHVQKWAQQSPPREQIIPYAQKVTQGSKGLDELATEVLKLKGKIHEQQAAQQQQPGQDQGAAPQLPPGPGGGDNVAEIIPFTEKVGIAWIGQFDKLPSDEQRRLAMLTGLSTPGIEAADTLEQQQGGPSSTMAPPPPPPAAPPQPPAQIPPAPPTDDEATTP
jgi:hypothetical protein